MSKFMLQQIFSAALESESENQAEHVEVQEDDAPLVTEDTIVVDGGEESMEAEMIEIQEGAADAERANDLVDDFDRIADGLESIHSFMEATLESGGLEPTAAAGVALAAQVYADNLGVEKSLVASVESFGGETDRVAATTLSMEAVGETLKQVWQAIKSAVLRALKAVADFFAKIFGGIDKVVSRAEALEKAVVDVKSKKAEGKIRAAGLGKLHLSGKADPAVIAKGLEATLKVSEQVYGDYAKAVEDYYKEIIGFSKGDKGLEAESTADKALLGKIMDVTMKEISGGRAFRTQSQTSTTGPQALPVLTAYGRGSVDESAEIDPMSVAEMESTLDAVKALAKLIKEQKSTLDAVAKARKDAVDAGDKFAEAADKGKLAEAWDKAAQRRLLKAINKDATRPITQLTAHNFTVMRAALAVVERSVKAYK